jgi:predicted nuclease with TOPRIM domain
LTTVVWKYKNKGDLENKDWMLPEPTPLMSAKSYKEKKANPLIEKLKSVIRSVVTQYLRLKEAYDKLSDRLWQLQEQVNHLSEGLEKSKLENEQLRNVAKDYGRVRKFFGDEKTDSIVAQVKQQEQAEKITCSKRNYER